MKFRNTAVQDFWSEAAVVAVLMGQSYQEAVRTADKLAGAMTERMDWEEEEEEEEDDDDSDEQGT